MPKLTFFNLPEDKKQTLLGEAIKEFSRVPLYDASISNIIKGAGIPRGSFYQYFEDKEDLYFYILGEYTKAKKLEFIKILEKNNGNIFNSFLQFFDLFIKDEENFSFLRNTLLNMTYKTEKTFEGMVNVKEFDNDFNTFVSLIDQSNLKIKNEKEFFHAIQLLMTTTIRNLIQVFAQKPSYEAAMENYRIELHLLMNGLSKN